jgi:hypothetical protein
MSNPEALALARLHNYYNPFPSEDKEISQNAPQRSYVSAIHPKNAGTLVPRFAANLR